MKILTNIARVLVGCLFIFSGIIKNNDPKGTGIKLNEYFDVFAAATQVKQDSLYITINDNLGNKESLLVLNSPELKLKNFDATSNNYLREKFNIPENCKIFIYLGIIGKGRGIDLYLDIFHKSNGMFQGHYQ